MTKIITFKCNLCHDECKLNEIYGIYFNGSWSNHKIELRPAREVEHHICHTCFNQIRELTTGVQKPD